MYTQIHTHITACTTTCTLTVLNAGGVRHDVCIHTDRLSWHHWVAVPVICRNGSSFTCSPQHAAYNYQYNKLLCWSGLFNLQKSSLWCPQDLRHWQHRANASSHPPFCPPKWSHDQINQSHSHATPRKVQGCQKDRCSTPPLSSRVKRKLLASYMH